MTPDQQALISAERKLADARQTLQEVDRLVSDMLTTEPEVYAIQWRIHNALQRTAPDWLQDRMKPEELKHAAE